MMQQVKMEEDCKKITVNPFFVQVAEYLYSLSKGGRKTYLFKIKTLQDLFKMKKKFQVSRMLLVLLMNSQLMI